ncbi:FAD-dependent oxidoreductase [Pelomonas sp. P7]|uniref:NADH:ubiquinone reductase (non-electrogenic) n=1 Tax=Pelomonas caseinilytica TaxID=2906763 RepID=A0ABS8XAA6_9BURK|nr:FAD-dependent oxidoreductase [Pelomonas sp. P7]MCE4535758.1 FAD-dependent oxidoreductase [Pelomonas sp. P7]
MNTSTPPSTPPLKTIVIAGGGFAGTTLARALEAPLPPGWQLVLLSEESYTTFNPMLAEVVGAAVFPEHVIAPIREMLAVTRFIMGRLERVDHEARTLSCSTLAGPLEMRFDHLVLAFGQRANLDIIPGLADHALPLKLVGDAMHIRNRLLQRLAHIELSADKAQRRTLGHFVVIGGGFSGVEVAGAVIDFIRSAHRCYPRVKARELRVTLLHDGERLLPELPAALGAAAAKSLAERGVDVRLGARAARVHADGVDLADGTRVASATVVCTIGARANPLVERLGVQTLRGRIVTDPDGQVSGRPGLWALGDCAATLNLASGQPSPPTAQFAVAQARQLARNLLRHIAGESTRPFHHVSRGMMATTGHHRGVAQVFGIKLAGLPAWLLWRAYYLMRMPTLGRKVRIWVEWTWSLFFPADVTHLRFTRTTDVETPPARPTQP